MKRSAKNFADQNFRANSSFLVLIPSMCVAIELDPPLHIQMDYCHHLSVQIGQAKSEEKIKIIMLDVQHYLVAILVVSYCEFFNYTAPEGQSRSIGSWKQSYYD